MPPEGNFDEKINTTQELIWIQDLERDAYISAHICVGPKGTPNWIYDVHILDKGRQLIEDFDSQRTFRGLWKRHHFAILVGILSIGSAVIIAILLHIYIR
jgi:hypothetical protein